MAERLASLISGGGTTMREIVRAVQSGEIPDMEVACVIASRPDAGGIEKARTLGIPDKDIVVVEPGAFRGSDGKIDRAAFGKRLLAVLEDHGATVVTQNGWIPYTPSNVIGAYNGRIFNQHPGDPVAFGGKGMMGKAVHAAVLEFQRLAGRTFATSVVAHHADPVLDGGAVVQRAKVPVLLGDTPETLQERALSEEHRVQIELLQNFVRLQVQRLESEHLVAPEEIELLAEAKRIARERYPEG